MAGRETMLFLSSTFTTLTEQFAAANQKQVEKIYNTGALQVEVAAIKAKVVEEGAIKVKERMKIL